MYAETLGQGSHDPSQLVHQQCSGLCMCWIRSDSHQHCHTSGLSGSSQGTVYHLTQELSQLCWIPEATQNPATQCYHRTKQKSKHRETTPWHPTGMKAKDVYQTPEHTPVRKRSAEQTEETGYELTARQIYSRKISSQRWVTNCQHAQRLNTWAEGTVLSRS